MKLIIDIGNTRSKVALFEDQNIFSQCSINDLNLRNVQEFVKNHNITNTIISSVKDFNSQILAISDYYDALILSDKTFIPIYNNYKTHDSLGKDRLAAVVGANYLYPERDIIVFDLGTCLTTDIISKKGEYIGGRISPGILMRYQSLHTFTHKLPLVKNEKSTSMFGDDTKTSILSGVQQGVLAEIKLVLSEYRLHKPDAIAVITGGDCFFFEKELKNSIFAHPNLILIGLNTILDFNE